MTNQEILLEIIDDDIESRFNKILNILKRYDLKYIIQTTNHIIPYNLSFFHALYSSIDLENSELNEDLLVDDFFYDENDLIDQEEFMDDEDFLDKEEFENEDELVANEEYFTKNIIISFNKNLKNRIVFSAHYDIVFNSKGANDNGSSLSILLNLACSLKNNKTNLPIDIVFFDKEETGSIGCKDFIEEFGNDVLTFINLDVCGVGDKIVILDECQNENIPFDMLKQSIVKKYDIIFTDLFPVGDAYHMSIKNKNNISISAFPLNDAILLGNIKFPKEIKDKLKKHEDYTNNLWEAKKEINANLYSMEIFKYMHNAEFDNIEYINYDIMQNILNYLLEITKEG